MTVVAVDLGASSVRVLSGQIRSDSLVLRKLHRVANEPVAAGGTLHWDILRLYSAVLEGLRLAGDDVASVGIDSWAVDYGLLDAEGRLLGNPVHYRDGRTDGLVAPVLAELDADRLYATTGIAALPINTLFQLAAMRGTAQLAAARKLLMIPDLITYWLTGEIGAEATNASTTELFDLHTGDWAREVIDRLGLPAGIFPPIRRPGDAVGPVAVPGLPAMPVTAVASHDTASAVAAVPARDGRFAYVSCGTWSLVGVELDRPVLTPESRAARFTNERGIDGTVRFLRNVMGLWLLQQSLRSWPGADLTSLLAEAAREPAFAAVVDADDPDFLAPGDMPARIAAACRRSGQAPPETPSAYVRCILDSLALGHRAAVRTAAELSGCDVDVVHVVGGGSRNALLCQLTADACGLPVLAGPVEATAIGNALVQARALGILGDRADMRRLVAATQDVRRYDPSGCAGPWAEAAARIGSSDQGAGQIGS